jgi:hypothetical protein
MKPLDVDFSVRTACSDNEEAKTVNVLLETAIRRLFG